MSHQSHLIQDDINAYLAQHERKELLRLLTCGSVDDGKSTLIGRLLHDSKLIYEDQLAAIAADSVKSGTTGGDIDLALLVDGLQAEREQGITIDVAYRYFSTARRKFIIADTPGHEQYTRNMATGASTCDLAIILIDARNGVQTQTRRHSFIASLLGIRRLIVAVNKMDLVDYSQQVFEDIKADYLKFSERLGYGGREAEGDAKPEFSEPSTKPKSSEQLAKPEFSEQSTKLEISCIPLSALLGDNVVNESEKMPWFDGPPLMTMLETVEITGNRNYNDFRFPVQYVNRPNPNFRGYCGTVASGVVHKGDSVTVMGTGNKGKSSRIKSIVTLDEELETAFADMAVTLTLEDEIDVSRGDLMVHSGNQPETASSFEATVVWMTDEPLLPDREYDFKLGCRSLSGRFKSLRHRIDVNTLQESPAPALELNEIGVCEVELVQPVSFDGYQSNRATGAFIVIDRLSNVTIGAGMIRGSARGQSKSRGIKIADSTADAHVTREERAARYGQKPATVMFVGVSGSGKSTLAHALERYLFNLGRACTVLDGKTMRLGISRDLPHDAEGRAENLRRSAHIARFLNDSGLICCASFVAPNRDPREHALSTIGRDNCYIVFLNPPMDVCITRDPSGLYASANAADAGDIPGLSFPYDPPETCHLELDTNALSVEQCIEQVVTMIREAGVI